MPAAASTFSLQTRRASILGETSHFLHVYDVVLLSLGDYVLFLGFWPLKRKVVYVIFVKTHLKFQLESQLMSLQSNVKIKN